MLTPIGTLPVPSTASLGGGYGTSTQEPPGTRREPLGTGNHLEIAGNGAARRSGPANTRRRGADGARPSFAAAEGSPTREARGANETRHSAACAPRAQASWGAHGKRVIAGRFRERDDHGTPLQVLPAPRRERNQPSERLPRLPAAHRADVRRLPPVGTAPPMVLHPGALSSGARAPARRCGGARGRRGGA